MKQFLKKEITKPKLSGLNNAQRGQTLIETVVAVFILVMGIAAALGLAVYSLNASSNVTKQIVAIGLAREGVEVVKNMRDSNWLLGTLSKSCYDFNTSQSNSSCYTDWLSPSGASGSRNGYNIDPGNSNLSQICIRVKPGTDSSKDSWDYKTDGCNNGKWGLDLDKTISGNNFPGVFGVSNFNQGVSDGNSDFYRKIVLTKYKAPPYDHSSMEKILVQSQVWWVDKKCPRVQDYTPGMKCGIELQTYLTNWKNY